MSGTGTSWTELQVNWWQSLPFWKYKNWKLPGLRADHAFASYLNNVQESLVGWGVFSLVRELWKCSEWDCQGYPLAMSPDSLKAAKCLQWGIPRLWRRLFCVPVAKQVYLSETSLGTSGLESSTFWCLNSETDSLLQPSARVVRLLRFTFSQSNS